jgi:protein-tyrosine-phosphatase
MEKHILNKLDELHLKQRKNNAIWSLVNQRDIPDPYRKSDEAFYQFINLLSKQVNFGLKN